ncbi:hypothetical protein EDP2_3888 [Enterobacter cloacae S611]|uniref:Uncharacterized protein n=1 Tax=Enterobacter cloacae S611 TaxID=1399146 RepID=A0ABN0Q9Q5_ENTCL|nr:hypothetical protein EDP2_3888 [Enterobacter cloacae S611]
MIEGETGAQPGESFYHLHRYTNKRTWITPVHLMRKV